MGKTVLITFIIVFILFSMVYASGSCFNDIENHWAEDSIRRMYDKGFVSGVGGSKFQPDGNILRCQFVSLLHKSLDIQISYLREPDITGVYKDVNNEDWFADRLYDLVMTGIIDDTGYFRPGSPLSREEMAHYLMKAYEYKTDKRLQGNTGALDRFNDGAEINSRYLEDVSGALEIKLIMGRDDGCINPKEACTRAEAVVVIERLMNVFSTSIEKEIKE